MNLQVKSPGECPFLNTCADYGTHCNLNSSVGNCPPTTSRVRVKSVVWISQFPKDCPLKAAPHETITVKASS